MQKDNIGFDKDIENAFKSVYSKCITDKPSFDEEMQKKIKNELEKVKKQAEEYLKNRQQGGK